MERKRYIDVAKGIAMLLVVMQHIGGTLDVGINVLCKSDVSLFFLCSGFLAYKPEIDILSRLKKNVYRIGFPFIFAVMAAAIFFQENPIDILISIGKRGYWFLEALFIMFFLFWPIYRSDKSLILGGILIECILLFASKYSPGIIDDVIGFSYLSRYYPCFIAGALLRKHEVLKLTNKWIGLLLLAVPIFGFMWNAPTTNISFLLHVMGYLGAALICFFTIVRFEPSLPKTISNQLTYIGKYSLNIYILHFFIVPYIAYLSQWFIVNIVVTLILAIIVTYASIAIGKLLTFATPLNRILTP